MTIYSIVYSIGLQCVQRPTDTSPLQALSTHKIPSNLTDFFRNLSNVQIRKILFTNLVNCQRQVRKLEFNQEYKSKLVVLEPPYKHAAFSIFLWESSYGFQFFKNSRGYIYMCCHITSQKVDILHSHALSEPVCFLLVGTFWGTQLSICPFPLEKSYFHR